MKKFTLSLGLLFIAIISYCDCPTISATMTRTSLTSNDYTLMINFIKHGENFHIEDTIFCNGIVITSGCQTFDVSGTVNIAFSCSGTPSAKITPYLGPCLNETFACASITVGPSSGPTPVVLSGYEVQRTGSNVVAAWKTEQEINFDHFAIERSVDNNKTFQEVGIVNSHGNSSVINNYSFVDKTNKFRGISSYRIKLLDIDGSIVFTDAKIVKGFTGKEEIIIYPNPSYGNAKVTITDLSEPTTIQVIDNSGRLIKTLTLSNSNFVEINKLQKGNYIFKMTGKRSGTITVKKLTVIN